MAAPLGYDWWWDHTWNPVGGCKPVSPGCALCYASQEAGTKTHPFPGSAKVHDNVVFKQGTRFIWNGNSTVAPAMHKTWTWPLTWSGAKHPKLGPGAPSLIFVGDMSDLFYEHEQRPDAIITRVCATIALSDPAWVRAVRDQCKAAGIPFFMKQMAKGAPIPPDLQIRQFPSVSHDIAIVSVGWRG
jgi:protein gp37